MTEGTVAVNLDRNVKTQAILDTSVQDSPINSHSVSPEHDGRSPDLPV